MKIESIELHRLAMPLVTPYRVSFAVFDALDPIIAEIRTSGGGYGVGETQITPGYSHETPEAAWALLADVARRHRGGEVAACKAELEAHASGQPGAACALLSAIEMAEGHPAFAVDETTRVPLLQPVHAMELEAIPDALEVLVAEGFGTLKVKVGFDVERDLERVALIQRTLAGRALVRLDANQGFDAAQGARFASALDPEGVMLFEQPCHEGDWEANAAVAAVSNVPVMMDESIYSLADIDRAAAMTGVGFVKLKLKKLGGVDRLEAGLRRIRALGLTPVLGDGMSVEVGCWAEACVAAKLIDNAGEMNGFLKPRSRLLENPLPLDHGDVVLDPGYRPVLDRDCLAAHRLGHDA